MASIVCNGLATSMAISQAGLGGPKGRAWGASARMLPPVECSSRPQKKATAHHNKSRPRKHSPYEKNRKPAFYPRLPTPPPIVTLDLGDVSDDAATAAPVAEPALAQ